VTLAGKKRARCELVAAGRRLILARTAGRGDPAFCKHDATRYKAVADEQSEDCKVVEQSEDCKVVEQSEDCKVVEQSEDCKVVEQSEDCKVVAHDGNSLCGLAGGSGGSWLGGLAHGSSAAVC
jgi:hypothetical protein